MTDSLPSGCDQVFVLLETGCHSYLYLPTGHCKKLGDLNLAKIDSKIQSMETMLIPVKMEKLFTKLESGIEF